MDTVIVDGRVVLVLDLCESTEGREVDAGFGPELVGATPGGGMLR
jgi:hypothetical protein